MATATEGLVLNENMAAGMSVQVTKVIRAKRERVFAAWTRPEVFRTWFGPGAKTVAYLEMDARVGGAYRIEMNEACAEAGRPANEPSKVWGVYREIVPNELVKFTWEGNWTSGEETVVTVSLKDVEGGTLVTILHERFSSDQQMAGHEQGWTSALAKMGEVLQG